MTKPQSVSTETTVRDPKSGRLVTVKGIGSLKGHLTLKKSIDLTKPIAAQALKGKRKTGPVLAKS